MTIAERYYAQVGANPLVDAPRRQREQLIVGTVVVSFLLLTSRWGSHLGVSPFYLTDVLLAWTFINAAVTALLKPKPRSLAEQPVSWFPITLSMFLVWCGYVLIRGEISVNALRDAAPYLYAVIGLVSYSSARTASTGQLRRTVGWLIVALSAHALWTFGSELIPGFRIRIPQLGELPFFSVRGDFDPLLVGLLGCIALWGAFSAPSIQPMARLGSILGALTCFGMMTMFSNRGALIGTGFAVGFILLGYMVTSFRSGKLRRAAIAALVPILVIVGILLLPLIPSGARLAATFGIDYGATDEYGNQAVGTASARADSWPILLDYIGTQESWVVQGIGFGPNFMLDSGAGEALVGPNLESQTEVRSPHNYWLGTFARIGLIGVGLVASLAIGLIATALRRVQRATSRIETVVPMVLAVGFLPTATVGVILESPFGSIPFWWSAGVFLALISRADLFPQSVDSSAIAINEINRSTSGSSLRS